MQNLKPDHIQKVKIVSDVWAAPNARIANEKGICEY